MFLGLFNIFTFGVSLVNQAARVEEERQENVRRMVLEAQVQSS